MIRAKHNHDIWNVTHAPRYPHDCSRCKFSWNCGPSCVCQLQLNLKHNVGSDTLTEAPMEVKLWANQFTHDDWVDSPYDSYGLPYPELEKS